MCFKKNNKHASICLSPDRYAFSIIYWRCLYRSRIDNYIIDKCLINVLIDLYEPVVDFKGRKLNAYQKLIIDETNFKL